MRLHSSRTSYCLAIVLILLAILLPALKSVRDKAKQISCCGNQRQLGTAFIMYVGDWNGHLPPLYYFEHISGAVNTVPAPHARKSRNNVFMCPATNTADQTYICEIDYAADYDSRLMRVEMIQDPSSQKLLVDADGNGTISPGLAVRIRLRHFKGANYLFLDGRVAWYAKNLYL